MREQQQPCITIKAQTTIDGETTTRRCNHPCAAGRHLCAACIDRAYTALQDIAREWAGLLAAQYLAQGIEEGEKVTKSRGHAAPGNLDAMSIADDVTRDLRTYVRILLDGHPALEGPRDPSIPTTAHWLASHIESLLTNLPLSDQEWLVGLLRRHRAHVRRITHPEEVGRHVTIGGLACPIWTVDDEGRRVRCGGEMYAIVTPGMNHMPDLKCALDDSHKIGPDQYQRRWFGLRGAS